MTDSPHDAADTTRRALLRRGIALAVAAPAVWTALSATTAFADHDDDDHNDEDEHHEDEHHDDDHHHQDEVEKQLQALSVLGRYTSRLCRVSEASGFSAINGNPGTDSLNVGLVRLAGKANNPDDDKIGVALRGVPASVSYTVNFLPSTGGRESLGVVGPTSSSGFLNALTPNALQGARRVGIFVLTRSGGSEDGRDEFVTCLGD